MKSHLKVTALISTIIMFIFLTGCDAFAKETMDFYKSTNSIDLSGEKINSISINSNENDVITAFGEPNNVEEIENPKSKYLSYDGVEFDLIDDKVMQIFIKRESENSKKYKTAKEIKIGNTKEIVIKRYGQNYYERVEGGLETVGYFDKDNMINIEFGFHENQVAAIIIQKIGWREAH
ncbi:hypothetical protein SAMN04488127_2826 [Bhargavaea ginsengi]|uniref:Lipoprotein n=1 Tax=Bhargavaea ginsengi TaxID=426757 RepID=A0A1H7BXU9_9BACL|nr:hypothetical protein [Bhargavaea ginsengi]SEJ79532.1 hypothetical protein SAMN04488127_2826 [Bhargavaea ginsengi]